MKLKIKEDNRTIEENTKIIEESIEDDDMLCGYNCNDLLIFTPQQFKDFIEEVMAEC